jgi:hypothetical protein
LVAQPLKNTRLFQDAHMTTIVSKETGRRDHQNAVGTERGSSRRRRPWR